MNNIVKKMILAVLAAALVFAVFPMTSVFAQGENPPKGELTNQKLEKIWARQLKNYKKISKVFEDADAQIARIQSEIDTAAENSKDVAALQVALDAFESALKNAKPNYDSIGGVVNAHQGFSADGKVTDAEQAKSTVAEMRTKMQELKSAMKGTGKALRHALKAFREANKPADTSTERDS